MFYHDNRLQAKFQKQPQSKTGQPCEKWNRSDQ